MPFTPAGKIYVEKNEHDEEWHLISSPVCSPFILRGVTFYDLDFSRCKEGSKGLLFSKC